MRTRPVNLSQISQISTTTPDTMCTVLKYTAGGRRGWRGVTGLWQSPAPQMARKVKVIRMELRFAAPAVPYFQ